MCKKKVKLDQVNYADFAWSLYTFDVLEKETKEKIWNKNSLKKENGKGGKYLEKDDFWFAELWE